MKKSSALVSKLSSFLVSKNKPIVGENAFAHESGIHQHGVINKRETYEIMDPKQVGQKTQINIGAQSGLKGIKYKLQYYKLDYKKIDLKKFFKIFLNLKIKNLKIVDKGLLTKLHSDFIKQNAK